MTPIYGKTNPTPQERAASPIKRHGSVIGMDPEKEEYYRRLHADCWEAVLERLRMSNIQNYSIYVTELEGKKYLFSYFEYVGNDYESDMKGIANDPDTQKWWAETDPCQIKLPNRHEGENWTEMEMVFLMDQCR
jgi:L-rhamnose mutarotase